MVRLVLQLVLCVLPATPTAPPRGGQGSYLVKSRGADGTARLAWRGPPGPYGAPLPELKLEAQPSARGGSIARVRITDAALPRWEVPGVVVPPPPKTAQTTPPAAPALEVEVVDVGQPFGFRVVRSSTGRGVGAPLFDSTPGFVFKDRLLSRLDPQDLFDRTAEGWRRAHGLSLTNRWPRVGQDLRPAHPIRGAARTKPLCLRFHH